MGSPQLDGIVQPPDPFHTFTVITSGFKNPSQKLFPRHFSLAVKLKTYKTPLCPGPVLDIMRILEVSSVNPRGN